MSDAIREFEWDPEKSAVNLTKHRLDFEAARAVWDHPYALTAPGKSGLEERFMTIGRISGKLWSAVHTYRNGRIRIISVRRSRSGEVAAYEIAIYQRTRL